MRSLIDWAQHQQTVWEEYGQASDRFGPDYDQLFSKLVFTEPAKSWEGFLKWTQEIQGPWCFRGQRESRWGLQTSLERSIRVCHEDLSVPTPDGGHFLLSSHSYLDRRKEESKLLLQFKQLAHQHIQAPPIEDNASWFALMQHYGVPTRLLDWTSSPYIALYFAIEHEPQDRYSAVWAIDLEWLEMKKNRYLELIEPKDKASYLDGLLQLREDPIIVKIDPLQSNQRMSAQNGFFLWKLYDETPFFDQILITMMRHPIQIRPVIKKLEIDEDLRVEFLAKLRNMNINRGSLFPDCDDFCQSLKSALQLEVAMQTRKDVAQLIKQPCSE